MYCVCMHAVRCVCARFTGSKEAVRGADTTRYYIHATRNYAMLFYTAILTAASVVSPILSLNSTCNCKRRRRNIQLLFLYVNRTGSVTTGVGVSI
jgi:hypothetical protein